MSAWRDALPAWREWKACVRSGDVLIFLIAAVMTFISVRMFWSADVPSMAIVRAHGKTVAQLPLDRAAQFETSGPLGITHIEIQPGRARVLSDPGPRQYCVKQGWLTRSGAIAICAPNEVSLALEGRERPYDSLSY